MTNIIQHLTQKEKHFPETSKCYLLVQSAKRCGCDLQSLYVTLCSSIHGAPWYGSSIKIFSKELREEDTCLLKAIADDMSLPYDLREQYNSIISDDNDDDNHNSNDSKDDNNNNKYLYDCVYVISCNMMM